MAGHDIKTFTKRHWTAIDLYLDGRSWKEVAELMGLAHVTLKKWATNKTFRENMEYRRHERIRRSVYTLEASSSDAVRYLQRAVGHDRPITSAGVRASEVILDRIGITKGRSEEGEQEEALIANTPEELLEALAELPPDLLAAALERAKRGS